MSASPPSGRYLVAPTLLAQVDDALGKGAFVGGWLLSGPPQIGKGSFAKALAAAVLSGSDSLAGTDHRTETQVQNEGHPDLAVLRREPDERGRLRAGILVDQIREMTRRLRQTSVTGRRVVVVDSADDLNVAAQNALLKTLEEPPRGALLLMLSAAPGRLLPTIRSRCRRLAFREIEPETIARWLTQGHGIEEGIAREAANAGRGRPERALHFAQGEGRDALALADQLVEAAVTGRDLLPAASAFSGKDAEDLREDAYTVIEERLREAARRLARGEDVEAAFRRLSSPHALVALHDEVAKLRRRGGTVNADRTQTALVVAMTLRNGLRGDHADR